MIATRQIACSLLIIGALVCGCRRNGSPDAPNGAPELSANGSIQTIPLTEPIQAGGQFTMLSPEDTGVDFTNSIDYLHSRDCLYTSAMVCGGVAIGDFDSDGNPDLFFTSGPKKNRLYRQTESLKFQDVTETAGVSGGSAWSVGAAVADIDDDGDLDIYVCNYDSPNMLFINNGDGTFKDQAKAYGVNFNDASHTPSFCDFDRDGDLDFYLMTNFYYDPRGKPNGRIVGLNKNKQPIVLPGFEKYYEITKVVQNEGSVTMKHDRVGRPDRLVRNNGNGTFTDISKAAGISGNGKGNSITWWDYNEDGWPDIYVGNDFQDPDRLYQNNGDGTFTNVIEEMVPHTTWFSMGADFGDLDGDGAFDFVIADMSGTNHFKQKTAMGAMSDSAEFLTTAVPRQYMRNVVYINSRGGNRLREAAHMTGLANSDWTWTVRTADFDNDGQTDVFFSNGMSRDLNAADNPEMSVLYPGETEWDKHLRAKTPELRQQNLAYKNQGNLRFHDVSKAWGLDHVGMSFAAATADLDRDGDLDLVVANLEEPVSVYRNDVAAKPGVLIRLMGTQSNRSGIGTRVSLTTESGKQIQDLIPVRGYMASHEPLIHFGLGKDEIIQQLRVEWPSGHTQLFKDLPAGNMFVVTEPTGEPDSLEQPDKQPTFTKSEGMPNVEHVETPFDDYARQPLLPNQYSQLGPGLSWGDCDNDGDEDLWIAGAKGQPAKLLIKDNGKFVAKEFATQDAEYEDMSAVWFDVDRDNDQDLYVVSGGVECDAESSLLQDRLYLNDGQGNFSRASEESLPTIRSSGGIASAADFDRDGDLDLFVGGRIVPGNYPLPPRSHLLLNHDGKLSDATADHAESLSQSGMVTGAVWSDIDDDGWIDLAVCYEWGAVRLFRNEQGKLIDVTSAAKLDQLLGWWNGISAADIDNDGDIDFAVTNFGLNTKYHASVEKPTLLYYGDFEQDGRNRIVEAEFEDETLFPVRGKSCSTHAMPHLANKFTTYTDFALAGLDDIYETRCLEESHRFEANTLESGILLNDGKGVFSFRPLPRLAQIAPGFGLQFCDTNNDHNTDLYVAQNFYGPQAETGRMAGGVSLLLHGNGDGTFTPVSPAESGLIVANDAKSLTRADINDDGTPDFVVGVNDGPLAAFENGNATPSLQVRLTGKPGNVAAVGSRILLKYQDNSLRAATITAGDSYLSQSSSVRWFPVTHSQASTIRVTWPDGTQSETDVTENSMTIAWE